MAPEIHILISEAKREFERVLKHVLAGQRVFIDDQEGAIVAVVSPPTVPGRKISESIALVDRNSTAVMDAEFARDVEAAIESHREPLNPPAWE